MFYAMIFLWLFGGLAGARWTGPAVGTPQYKVDKRECRAAAREAEAFAGWYETMTACMEDRGYVRDGDRTGSD